MNGRAIAMRSLRALQPRGTRSMGGHAKVHMPETAMITNNGTHKFERKGWEYSTYMGIVGGPIVLYLGISNVPETDSEVSARAEAFAKRRGQIQFNIVRRPSGPISTQFVYERAEIGERPSLVEL